MRKVTLFTTRGTSQLLRHIFKNNQHSDAPALHNISKEKELINQAAITAAKLDTIPMRICHPNPGFLMIARSLFKLDTVTQYPLCWMSRMLFLALTVCVVQFLPSRLCFTNKSRTNSCQWRCALAGISSVMSLNAKKRAINNTISLSTIFMLGVLILLQESVAVESKETYFLSSCTRSGNTGAFRNIIDNSLKMFNTSVEKLKNSFNFVTTYTAKMAVIFGASISPNLVPFSDWWMDSISHQLNYSMNNEPDNFKDNLFNNNLNFLKKLVTYFKEKLSQW